MILKSLVDNEEYFWIKIPRTATLSFNKFFRKYNAAEPGSLEGKHYHYSYVDLQELYKKTLPAVSVVRHPLSRFKSIIYYLADRFIDIDSDINLLWQSTDSCVTFLNKFFGRNCHINHGVLSSIFFETETTIHTGQNYYGAISSFFKTQVFWAYHPKLKIFHYEKLQEFIDWIDVSLKYDVNDIPLLNVSTKNTNINIDFDNPEFVKVVENMYHIDYKLFGYPLQYLT